MDIMGYEIMVSEYDLRVLIQANADKLSHAANMGAGAVELQDIEERLDELIFCLKELKGLAQRAAAA